jgi:BTB/POZ domain-containing protein KCTD9
MGNRTFETFLLYRASRDGWTGKDFHSRCDDKGATISLYKIKDGSCFGGFTSESWLSNPGYPIKKDSTSMLFNLTHKRFFPNKDY